MKTFIAFALKVFFAIVYFFCLFKIIAFIFHGAFSVPTDIMIMFLLLMAGVASVVLSDFTVNKLLS